MIEKRFWGPLLINGDFHFVCEACNQEGLYRLTRITSWNPFSRWRVEHPACGFAREIDRKAMVAALQRSSELLEEKAFRVLRESVQPEDDQAAKPGQTESG